MIRAKDLHLLSLLLRVGSQNFATASIQYSSYFQLFKILHERTPSHQ